jgi:hypothetical protein
MEASGDKETRRVQFSPEGPETRMITPDETSMAPSQDASTEHREPTSKYGKLEQEGAQRRRWMDDPNEPDCKILLSTLTFDRLCEMCDVGPDDVKREDTPPLYKQRIRDLGLPIELVYQHYTISCNDFTWQGYTGPGMILIDDIRRAKTDTPPISQITQALYERDHSISSLKHIFVFSVINDVTETFLKRQLYTEANGLQWLRDDDVLQTWAFGIPEYDALLGTPIGKLVAKLVLGAFDRGTRRIRQVVTWSTWSQQSMNMRFDIEVIGSQPEASQTASSGGTSGTQG